MTYIMPLRDSTTKQDEGSNQFTAKISEFCTVEMHWLSPLPLSLCTCHRVPENDNGPLPAAIRIE